jgi:1-phosphofructokinase family hexose kinase
VIVCVAPTPAVDRLLELPGPLTAGEIHRPVRVVAVAGGKGLNVARAAKALGAPVLAVAPLGGANGRWIEAQLTAKSIGVQRVEVAAEPRVCVSVAGAGQALTELYEPAPPLEQGQWAAFEHAVTSAAGAATWVTLSGSLPPGSPLDGPRRLVEAAHAAGAAVALDMAGEALRSGLSARPELVKINAREAQAVAGGGSPGAVARQLAELSGGVAAVTHGDAGIVLAVDDVVLEAGPPVRGRYPVGCGDVALAALVAACSRGASWRAAISLAAAASAVAAEVPGAGVLDAARAWRLAETVEVRP